MRRTVALAKQHGVAVGAHPGFPDLVGFGRREMQASPRRGRGHGALSGGRAGRRRRSAGCAPAARQGARRALQHGGARRALAEAIARARRGVRSVADPVRPAGLGAAARRASAPACASRPKCSPTAPTRPTARCLAPKAGQRHPRSGDGSSRAPSRWCATARSIATDGSVIAAARRHDLPARRHAGRRDSGPPRPRGARGRWHHGRCRCKRIL